MEAFCTAVLAFTVFSTVDQTRHDHSGSGPLAIGFAVGLSHFYGVTIKNARISLPLSLRIELRILLLLLLFLFGGVLSSHPGT